MFAAEVEYRQVGRRGAPELSGRFPYRQIAVVRDRGRIRKEVFEPRAFGWAVGDPDRRILLLSGHDYSKPLAVKSGDVNTLTLRDSDDALSFTAVLPEASEQPTWIRDVVRAVGAGLVGGVSPGFSIPPASAVSDAESLEPEDGNPSVMVRVIRAAVLHELSLVTLPAYRDTEVELRADARRGGRRVWSWL